MQIHDRTAQLPALSGELADLRSATSDTSRGAFEEWRAGWRAGFAAFIGLATCLPIWANVSSLFVQPLQDEFGWSRTQIVFAYNASLVSAIAAPFFGQLIDRVGIRRILLAAMVLTALGYIGLASVSRSLPVYYFFYLWVNIFGICTSGLGFTRVVSAAFERSRGTALAVARLGNGAAGAIFPPLMFSLIVAEGWRTGFLLLAGLIVFVALPAAWFGIDRGGQGVMGSAKQSQIWIAHLKERKVVLLCSAAGLMLAPSIALLMQLSPVLTNKGLAPQDSALLLSMMGVAVIVGALLGGFLVDRIWAPLVACIFTLGPASGCLLLVPDHVSLTTAAIAVVCLGLAQGAELDLVAYMVARYFGLHSYATIYGITSLSTSVCITILNNVIALLYAGFGNYQFGIITCAASLTLAAAFFLAMGRYPKAR